MPKKSKPATKNPSFKFYPDNWLNSEIISLMTLDEEGIYIRLLCYCCKYGSIPSDSQKILFLVGKNSSLALINIVKNMFAPDLNNSERLVPKDLNNLL